MKNVRIIVSRRAAQQIKDRNRWWRQNRKAAPNLFMSEYRAALRFLRSHPEGAQRVDEEGFEGVRRYVMLHSKHKLFYRAVDDYTIELYACVGGAEEHLPKP